MAGAPAKAEPLTVQLATRLTEDEHATLARLAEAEGRSVSALVRLVLTDALGPWPNARLDTLRANYARLTRPARAPLKSKGRARA